MVEQRFEGKQFDLQACQKFEFRKENESWIFQTPLDDCGFELVVILNDEHVETQVFDEFYEEYILHHIASAQGHFVGKVREAVEACLDEIEKTCCKHQLYHNPMTLDLIEYIKNTYGDELEYLWKSSTNAIWRRKDTQTWYAACLVMSTTKLGLEYDERCEVINVRVLPERMEEYLEQPALFPAYHMNKKHWVSILLDGTMAFETVCQMINESYRLTKK